MPVEQIFNIFHLPDTVTYSPLIIENRKPHGMSCSISAQPFLSAGQTHENNAHILVILPPVPRRAYNFIDLRQTIYND